MKAVIAYIKPHMLEKVADALRAQKIHGVTVIQCRGFGRRLDGETPHYEDAAVDLGFALKTKLEIVCPDQDVHRIVRTIRESAHTGRHGDGKIFTMEVAGAMDVRTGEEGEDVL